MSVKTFTDWWKDNWCKSIQTTSKIENACRYAWNDATSQCEIIITQKDARIKELEDENEKLKSKLLDNAVDKLLLSASELSTINQDIFAMSVVLTCKTWGVDSVLKNLNSRNENGLIRWLYEQIKTLKELGIKDKE